MVETVATADFPIEIEVNYDLYGFSRQNFCAKIYSTFFCQLLSQDFIKLSTSQQFSKLYTLPPLILRGLILLTFYESNLRV
jgi:hypothetical protein